MYIAKTSLISSLLATILICLLFGCLEEDKSKRLSPPAKASETIANGNTITINYSKISLKGRTIGKDIAPFDTVWQTGENEATTFEITKDAKIEGSDLAKGKYSLYTIPGKKNWTIVFNKTWDQWGTEYNKDKDALRVQVTPAKAPDFVERMKFTIERDGRVLLFWGETVVGFKVE
jgi:hypothetical protein